MVICCLVLKYWLRTQITKGTFSGLWRHCGISKKALIPWDVSLKNFTNTRSYLFSISITKLYNFSVFNLKSNLINLDLLNNCLGFFCFPIISSRKFTCIWITQQTRSIRVSVFQNLLLDLKSDFYKCTASKCVFIAVAEEEKSLDIASLHGYRSYSPSF